MAVRVNTLGKSAILNRQLNSSYDVVEYVADNMPLLLDLVKKFDTLKIVRDIYDIINHVANQEIHLTEEQVNSLNQIETISAALEQAGINVSGLTNQLTTLSNSLQQHINNNVIHVTDEDKTLWNSYADTLQALTDLINQVDNKDIDYNDLKNKPVLQNITIDSALDSTSRNPLENRAIVSELTNYPIRSNISRVGFTGQYRDLVGIPSGDTVLDSTSTNWVSNQCVTEAIEDLAASIANAGLSEAQVKAIVQSELSVYKLDLFTIVSVLPQSGVEGIAYLVPIQGQSLKFNIYTWEVIDDTTNPYTYGFVQFGGGSVTVDLSNYYTKTETDNLLSNKASSSHTHTTSDINNFPTIPSKTSDLTNDSCIPLSGTNAITGTGFFKSTNNSQLQICSGTSTITGGCFVGYGSEYSNTSVAGAFRLRARSGNTSYDFVGYANGNLQWSGSPITYTSDSRLKSDIESISDEILDAWENLEPKQYKYKSDVETNKDTAQTHYGWIAQDVENLLKGDRKAEVQNGLFTHDYWDEQKEISHEETYTEEVETKSGEKQTVTKTRKVIDQPYTAKGDSYGLRYTECLVVECKYLRRCIKQLTARIEQLEMRNTTK